MTILVAVRDAEGTWLGSDSHTETGGLYCDSGGAKWKASPWPGWAIASAGAMPIEILSEFVDSSNYEFSVDADGGQRKRGILGIEKILRDMREAIKQAQINPVTSDEDNVPWHHFHPLLASEVGVFHVSSTLWSCIPRLSHCGVTLAAAGSGCDYALGAMFQRALDTQAGGQDIVLSGVSAAVNLSPSCSAPIYVNALRDILQHQGS